jgi:hypothetical protein
LEIDYPQLTPALALAAAGGNLASVPFYGPASLLVVAL